VDCEPLLADGSIDNFMVLPVVALCIPLQRSVTMCLVERTRAR